MLQLIESHDVIKIESVVVHVFSDPGVGKTTLGNTGRKVVLIDFDGGAHRSLGRQRVARLDKWSDLEEFLKHAWLDDAETLVVDTVGRALDLLADEIIAGDAKLGTPLGGLNQRGWGALKTRFTRFFRAVRDKRKDVILLSHAKVDKDKDGNKVAYPDIAGGSAGEVFKVSDAMAYYSIENGRRVLDFNATDFHVGKNPPAWPRTEVPDYAKASTFLADKILAPLKGHLNALTAEQVTVLKGVADWQAAIEGYDGTPEALTAGIAATEGIANPAVKAQAKTMLWRRATKTLGFEFDRDAKAFKAPKPEPPKEAPKAEAPAEQRKSA